MLGWNWSVHYLENMWTNFNHLSAMVIWISWWLLCNLPKWNVWGISFVNATFICLAQIHLLPYLIFTLFNGHAGKARIQNVMFASRILFNPDIAEVIQFRNRYIIKALFISIHVNIMSPLFCCIDFCFCFCFVFMQHIYWWMCC